MDVMFSIGVLFVASDNFKKCLIVSAKNLLESLLNRLSNVWLIEISMCYTN